MAKLLNEEVAPAGYLRRGMEIKEFPLEQLIFTLLTMLIGKEGVEWAFYETDPKWWELRLYTRIN